MGEKHRQLRSSAKRITDVSAERDKAIHDQQAYKSSRDLELKEAVKLAKKEEREYLSKVKAEATKKVAASECRINAHQLLIHTLNERTRFAENEVALAKQQAKQSVRNRYVGLQLLIVHLQELRRCLSRRCRERNLLRMLCSIFKTPAMIYP